MTNCYETCRYAGENFDCDGQCCTNNIQPIETLTDEQLERGAGSSLTVLDDKPEQNGGW